MKSKHTVQSSYHEWAYFYSRRYGNIYTSGAYTWTVRQYCVLGQNPISEYALTSSFSTHHRSWIQQLTSSSTSFAHLYTQTASQLPSTPEWRCDSNLIRSSMYNILFSMSIAPGHGPRWAFRIPNFNIVGPLYLSKSGTVAKPFDFFNHLDRDYQMPVFQDCGWVAFVYKPQLLNDLISPHNCTNWQPDQRGTGFGSALPVGRWDTGCHAKGFLLSLHGNNIWAILSSEYNIIDKAHFLLHYYQTFKTDYSVPLLGILTSDTAPKVEPFWPILENLHAVVLLVHLHWQAILYSRRATMPSRLSGFVAWEAITAASTTTLVCYLSMVHFFDTPGENAKLLIVGPYNHIINISISTSFIVQFFCRMVRKVFPRTTISPTALCVS